MDISRTWQNCVNTTMNITNITNIHGGIDTSSLSSYFSVLKKCQTKFLVSRETVVLHQWERSKQTKFDCLLYEMFLLMKRNFNLQSICKRTPFGLGILLDCVSRVNSITSCFILIICLSSFPLLDNDWVNLKCCSLITMFFTILSQCFIVKLYAKSLFINTMLWHAKLHIRMINNLLY